MTLHPARPPKEPVLAGPGEQLHGWSWLRDNTALEIVTALSISALLSAIALAVLSSTLPLSGGTGNGDVNGTATSILSITPETAHTGAGLVGQRPFAITTADLDAINRGIPDTAVLSRVVSGAAPVGVGTGPEAPQIRVLGVDPSYALLPEGSVAPGVFFTAEDATAANRVAILGHTLATSLFPNGQSAIGRTIHIRNQPFTVLGVLASHSTTDAKNMDDAILIPFQTSQVRMFGATPIDEVLLAVRDAAQTNGVAQQIEDLLRQRHRVPSGQPDGFTIVTAPTSSSTEGAVPQVIAHVLQFSRQYACTAKGLCGTPRTP